MAEMTRPSDDRMPGKDKAALVISSLALIVSILTPIFTYFFLNQSERDDRDKKQLIVWVTGGGGTAGTDFDGKAYSETSDYLIHTHKGGVLPVGNVQILLQFSPAFPKDKYSVAVDSPIETLPPYKEDNGRVRIRVKNPLAATSGDITIRVSVSISGVLEGKTKPLASPVLRGAWLYSDAISGQPIQAPTDGGGGGNY
jgi:hypothetical protein